MSVAIMVTFSCIKHQDIRTCTAAALQTMHAINKQVDADVAAVPSDNARVDVASRYG